MGSMSHGEVTQIQTTEDTWTTSTWFLEDTESTRTVWTAPRRTILNKARQRAALTGSEGMGMTWSSLYRQHKVARGVVFKDLFLSLPSQLSYEPNNKNSHVY